MAGRGADFGAALGVRIAQIGSRVREESLGRTTPALTKAVADVANSVAEQRARVLQSNLNAWLQDHASDSPLPAAVTGLFGAIGRMGGWLFQQVLGTAVGFGVGGALSSVLEPYFNDMTQAAWRSNPSAIQSPANLAQMVVQGIRQEGEAASEALSSGVTAERFTELVALAGDPPGLLQLFDLWNRGEITEEVVDRALAQSRLKREYQEPVKALARVLPSVGDLIRFAVREVFNPSARRGLDLDAEFPDEFARQAALLGLEETTAKDYWAAHWALPSITQGFEMFHRAVITDADLDLLLKAQDVAPVWRGRLKEIAYNIVTRVDIRRMYAAGVVDRDRVLRTYLDLGYNAEDAEALTAFAVGEKLAPERDLAKTEVLALWEARAIREPDAREMLAGLGYDGREADLLLAIGDARRERSFRESAIRSIRSRFVGRKITDREAQAALARIGLAGDQTADLLGLWEIEREANVRDLTDAQWRTLLRRGLVDEGRFTAEMMGRGYSREEADWLVQLTVGEG